MKNKKKDLLCPHRQRKLFTTGFCLVPAPSGNISEPGSSVDAGRESDAAGR